MKPRGDLQLSIGYWIASHKQTLQKWWAIGLLLFIAGSLLWVVIFFTLFFRFQAQDDVLIRQAAGRLGRLLVAAPPESITVGEVTAIRRDRQHLDLLTWAANPNTDWGAVRVQYHWLVGDQATPSATVFINPESRRPIIGLNISAADADTPTSFVLEDVEWTRVGPASLPPASFTTEGLTLAPTTVTVNGQPIPTVSLKATVMNRSVYNYYHITVPIVVLAGDRAVAVDVLSYDRWPTLTSRAVNSSWSYAVSGATTAQILPQVNQFDLTNIYR